MVQGTIIPPTTATQLSHAMVIRKGQGNVGAINEWNPRMNRTLTDLYEFGSISGTFGVHAPGEPFEVVPGNVGGMTIDCRRWDQYGEQVETALTGAAQDVTMLSEQLDAFEVREVWTVPAGSGISGFYRNYTGCWWQDNGRTIDAKGDRTVNAGGTIRYTHRERRENG